ncbi:Glutamine amidotransferase [Kitasatospora sp. MMS16-BH015]|uniref:DJ-1/PfpI family protein n=1 Tax=Kitasatospora sp. MMS16-BH015 TaxID=2018025 RepID=UPI000CA161DE|nr:DJ-1/PfpI family protein [Kitasatospora sp. MMS16-BH015]AUG76363.1 Glutamine amidotransferase [Kitasatospora sp. MMS16-BH015]
MRTVIPLFDRFTGLDAVGPYEMLAAVPGAEVVFAAAEAGPVRSDTGFLTLHAELPLRAVTSADLLLVPGGPGQAARMAYRPLLDWLRAIDATTTWTASVCTGSLLLAAAGLLTGRRATTHWLAKDQLAPLGAVPAAERVVFDGKYATAAGVSAGIDLALHLIGRTAGHEIARAVQLGTEYAPEPPYAAGTPETAPPALVTALRARRGTILGTADPAHRTG